MAVETCRACMALDRDRVKRAATEKPLRKAGRTPDSWQVETVLPIAELPPADQAAIRAGRERAAPQQT